MKKAWMIMVALLTGGLLVCACGYGGQGLDGGTDGSNGNECELAAEVFCQGFDQACASLVNACCFCKCWFDDRKTFDGESYAIDQTCLCEPMQTNPQPCEGEYLTQAQTCLADQAACRQQAVILVTDPQIGQCTQTPL